MKQRSTLWRVIGALIVVSLLLSSVACGSSSTPPATGEPASGDAPAGSASGSEKDTLVVLQEEIGEGWDTDGTEVNIINADEKIDLAYDMLLSYKHNQDGKMLIPDWKALEGGLAESWTTDGLKTTVKLRPGVKSIYGNTLTADDVIWTFARGKSCSGAIACNWFVMNVSSIFGLEPTAADATEADKALQETEVRKIDDMTVEFTQKEFNSAFPMTLANICTNIYDSTEMKKHATEDDPWAHKWGHENPAGFGPYGLESMDSTQITMKWNPNYYGPKPQFTKLVFKKVPENANRVAAIQTGEADVVTGLTPRELSELSKSPNVDILGGYAARNLMLILNFKVEPWSLEQNKLLRQAVAYALPYQQIIDSSYYGAARRWYSLIPPGYVGQKDVKTYETDIAKAKELLAQAGFPDGKGLEKYASGLQLYYPIERKATLETVGNQIQTALAQIGIPITLSPIPNTEFTDRRYVKRDVPMALDDTMIPWTPDGAYNVALFWKSVEKGGMDNAVNYNNAEVDALTEKALGMSLGAERDAVMGQVQDIMMDELPAVPITSMQYQVAVRKGITNWKLKLEDWGSYYELEYKP